MCISTYFSLITKWPCTAHLQYLYTTLGAAAYILNIKRSSLTSWLGQFWGSTVSLGLDNYPGAMFMWLGFALKPQTADLCLYSTCRMLWPPLWHLGWPWKPVLDFWEICFWPLTKLSSHPSCLCIRQPETSDTRWRSVLQMTSPPGILPSFHSGTSAPVKEVRKRNVHIHIQLCCFFSVVKRSLRCATACGDREHQSSDLGKPTFHDRWNDGKSQMFLFLSCLQVSGPDFPLYS